MNQITDHAFVKPPSGKDECTYTKCGFPECMHTWTVGAHRANKAPATS